MEQVNEKSTVVITAKFKDENGAAVTPNSATYRLDDESSGDELIPEMTVNPSSSSYNIVIPAETNTILNQDKSSEVKILTVLFLYEGSTKQGSEEYRYAVKNLAVLS